MDALELTKKLVAFESPSHVSNSEVSLYLGEQLRRLGFDVETVTYRDHAGIEKVNVLGRMGPEAAGQPGLAYFCHSDVVPADVWTGPGGAFKPTEHDSKLYGRGSCDMKGSAACMLSAIAQMDTTQLDAPLYFTCTADEELSYTGAKHVVSSSKLFREMVATQPNVVIGEPTELRIVHAHKGICLLRATSHGESAHSSTNDGLNANLAMIPFLQELKLIYEETESDSNWHNLEFDPPSMTWNIGINDHTKAINVKPARSVCKIFYRPLPGIDDSPLIARVQAAADSHGLELELLDRCDALYTDPNDAFVREALQLRGQATANTVSYGTDGGAMPELRRKIVCGPGSISQAHTEDEWIALDQLEQGTELYKGFVKTWCTRS